MSWQDAVLAIGQVVFVLALLPALASRTQKPPLSTCWTTGVTLLACGAAVLTHGLAWGGVAMLVTALCWLVMGAQQLRSAHSTVITVNVDGRLTAEQAQELVDVISRELRDANRV